MIITEMARSRYGMQYVVLFHEGSKGLISRIENYEGRATVEINGSKINKWRPCFIDCQSKIVHFQELSHFLRFFFLGASYKERRNELT